MEHKIVLKKEKIKKRRIGLFLDVKNLNSFFFPDKEKRRN